VNSTVSFQVIIEEGIVEEGIVEEGIVEEEIVEEGILNGDSIDVDTRIVLHLHKLPIVKIFINE
jgi:hypothetical protein